MNRHIDESGAGQRGVQVATCPAWLAASTTARKAGVATVKYWAPWS